MTAKKTKRRKAGGPPKYATPGALEKKIEEFFSDEDRRTTISGLCFFLGFASRQSFYDLENNEKFSYTIKRARLRIESYYEEMLLSRSLTGAIFALKNFGWKDRQEIEVSEAPAFLVKTEQKGVNKVMDIIHKKTGTDDK